MLVLFDTLWGEKIIDTDSIKFVESEKNILNVYTDESKYSLRISLKNFMQHPAGESMCQINRKNAINIKCIDFYDDVSVTLNDGMSLTLSRRRGAMLRKIIRGGRIFFA